MVCHLRGQPDRRLRCGIIARAASDRISVEGSGTANRPPLERVHPAGATTMENQLLAVPLVRSINWNVSDGSGVKLSKLICAVPSRATEPTSVNRSNWLASVPATSNVVAPKADKVTSYSVIAPGLLPMSRLPNTVAPESVPEPKTSP